MTGPTPDWGTQLRGLAEAASGLLGALGSTVPTEGVPADSSAECRTCPVCTALAVVRGRRPDLSEALADVLATAATALRAHARPEGSAGGAAADEQPADEQPAPAPEAFEELVSPLPPPAPVQHIEVA